MSFHFKLCKKKNSVVRWTSCKKLGVILNMPICASLQPHYIQAGLALAFRSIKPSKGSCSCHHGPPFIYVETGLNCSERQDFFFPMRWSEKDLCSLNLILDIAWNHVTGSTVTRSFSLHRCLRKLFLNSTFLLVFMTFLYKENLIFVYRLISREQLYNITLFSLSCQLPCHVLPARSNLHGARLDHECISNGKQFVAFRLRLYLLKNAAI